ncbi:MAG TPA: RNA polymerase sigma factor [Vicinamibacteria bacterium]|nr:RNA polymerase sigma factor [Vicinamibacteria bacterium]
MDVPDGELMRRLARGERDALRPLMERHHRRVYRIALAYLRNPDDALDVVQETFVRAFEHAGRWHSGTEVGPWLTRIAVNQAIDRYRREKRRRETMEPLEPGDHQERLGDGAASPEQQAHGRELGARIARALKALPERQRAVFVLRHYEERSLEEIASALGIRLGTVKSSLHRATHELRRRLQGVWA